MRQTLLHGLFPQVRAEILRLLFTNPRTELYVRELARLSDLSLQTVQDDWPSWKRLVSSPAGAMDTTAFIAPIPNIRSMPPCEGSSSALRCERSPSRRREASAEHERAEARINDRTAVRHI